MPAVVVFWPPPTPATNMKRLSDRYSLGERIGRGGVGEVYRGWQEALDRPVAIKVLRPELTRHPNVVARFEREARTTCRLHHPNVVTVFDVGVSDDGARFLVMELLEGETLASRLTRQGALPMEEALHIARQIIRGMGAGQGVGLVHRDLKPDNIFLLAENHVKILDFGLATLLDAHGLAVIDTSGETTLGDSDADARSQGRETLSPEDVAPPAGAAPVDAEATVFDSMESVLPTAELSVGAEARLTRPGTPVGTPRYMAPEQVLGWQVDHRSDLYSFGCILFEMFSGRSAFEGPNSRSFMHQHLHVEPLRLSDHSDAPAPIVALVHRLMEKSPSMRFSDWSAVAEALRRISPEKTPALPVLPTDSESPRPREPYRFLSPFSRASRDLYFGREQDSARFLSAWNHPDEPPMIILTGASGVGKTSFLSARVVPALEDLGIRVIRVRGGTDPTRQLTAMLARELARTSDAASASRPLAQLLDSVASQEGRPIAVILDQLEEVFTSGSSAESERLQARIAEIVAGGGEHSIRLILSMREDYFGALLRALHPLPTDELARTLPLRPLDAADLKAALEGPTQAGLNAAYTPFRFEAGLTDRIVTDLLSDTAGEVAPRVQAIGTRLWEMVKDDPDPLITLEHYRGRLGGARGILARLLDEAIDDLSPADQGVAKELLRALTHLPGSPTSRPAPQSELIAYDDAERRERILRRLEDRWRIIQGFTDERWPEERTYRITHEALVARIQEYGEEGTERNRARRLFHHGLSLWIQGGRRDQDLLSEYHFTEIRPFTDDLVFRTADEREFFEACKTLLDDRWVNKMSDEKRRKIQRQSTLILTPLLFVLIGGLLGQYPVDFVTVHLLRIRAAIALNVPAPDLTGASLRGQDFSGLTLRNARMAGADLREASLNRANLEGANLSGARLQDADLSGAVLTGANLEGAELRNTRFDRADLRKAVLLQTDWQGINPEATPASSFVGAKFNGETLWERADGDAPPTVPELALGPWGSAPGLQAPGARLSNLDLYHLSAPGADFSEAELIATALTSAELDGAILSGAKMTRVRLERASLKGADLSGANLADADLTGTDLTGADLTDANLSGAVLSGARLDDTKLCGTDLSQANLSHVSLTSARYCAETTRWPTAFVPPDDAVAQQVAQ